jgi:dCMP deaminase
MDWDDKFMDAAKYFGSWSKCFSRKVGAIIVKDKTIIATGFNGPPRGVPHCDSLERLTEINRILALTGQSPLNLDDVRGKCPRKVISDVSGDLLHLCQAGHAEQNAITNAAREGIAVKDASMYCYCPQPCYGCAKNIINAGIGTLYYFGGDSYDEMSNWLLMNSRLRLVPMHGQK